jgi:hypothetical protein
MKASASDDAAAAPLELGGILQSLKQLGDEVDDLLSECEHPAGVPSDLPAEAPPMRKRRRKRRRRD